MSAPFNDLLRASLRFEYQAGGIAPLGRGHTTGWRVLPGLMLSQAHRGAERIFLEAGREFLARTGELIVLPAGVRHKVDVAGASEVRVWVHVNYFVLDGLDVFSLLEVPVHFGREVGEPAGAMIREWAESEARRAKLAALEQAAALNEFGFRLLGLLAPHCRAGSALAERVRGLSRLSPVIDHIRRNFRQPIYRDELARMASLSPTQFHLAFRRATGASPIKFAEGLRLRRAQHLLITTGRKMADIARECGYPDPYAFSKFFKRSCGHSPSAYRLSTRDVRGEESVDGVDQAD